MHIVVYRHDLDHAREWENAFIAGLNRHNVIAEVRDLADVVPCDLAVFWGHRHQDIIDAQRRAGARYLVMERGYLGDRMAWTSLGFNGLNGLAHFVTPETIPGIERFNKLFSRYVLPHRTNPGDYFLIMGQVPGDAALRGVDLRPWYLEAADFYRSRGARVLFRPHPLDSSGWHMGENLHKGTLQNGLGNAIAVVTWNSNSGVDAAAFGAPVIACDEGSMARAVAGHELTLYPPRPNRIPWAARLAWCQWSKDEIMRGDAWAHIGAGIDDVPMLARPEFAV